MKYNQSISVFVPAYNEEENLTEVTQEIVSFLDKNFKDYEFIIVANKSKDKTQEIARNLSKNNKKIKVIIQKNFVGYGTQLKSGWEFSSKELVFYTDSDRQFDINELHNFMKHIKTYDAVIGYRSKRKDPFMRVFYSWLYNQAIRRLLNIRVRDVDCAFKLCRKGLIDAIRPFTQDRGADAEFLVKAFAKNYKVKELPVTHRSRIAGVSEAESNSKGFFVRIKPEIISALIIETMELRKFR